MKLAIIGAGGAGLAILRHAIDEGFDCELLEQTGEIGGVWNYVERVGLDENGLPVHTAMYKGLKTNLPKETMTFLDVEYPKELPSYCTQKDVFVYMNAFAERFSLRKHIKFFQHVTKVDPLKDTSKWSISTMDAKSKLNSTNVYDAVAVCTGHYSTPFVPRIPGDESFKGRRWHSREYRSPECFQGKRVLVVGAGPSGFDITNMCAPFAKEIYLSHRAPPRAKMAENVVLKPEPVEIFEYGAKFLDSTTEYFDEIFYCTGYFYSYPFLTNNCGVSVCDNWVKPLYKHVINIEHPTMGFLGIPFTVCPFPMFEIQAKFFLSSLKGNFQLPSKQRMLEELEELRANKAKEGIPTKRMHQLGNGAIQDIYFNELADEAKVKRMPVVLSRLYDYVKSRNIFADVNFRITDDENFVVLDS